MSDWLRWLLIAAAVLAAVGLVVGRRVSPDRLGLSSLRMPNLDGRGSILLSVVAWLLVAIVVAGGTTGGLLWFLGWPKLPTAGVFGVDQLLDLLKIALSVVAGFGGVVLLAVNYRKQRVTEQEHDLAVDKADRETVQSFNERLGTAAEQLAHESPAVRLTGVYALAGLADDWADKRQVCVDVLCGYLRLQPEVMTPGETEVRQAILRMIRDRLTGFEWWLPVDFDFTGVVFENADFSGLRFPGRVIFDRADFTGELTSFDRARFEGLLSCHGTRFTTERTSFTSAWLNGGAEFVGAEFGGRHLACSRWDARGPVDLGNWAGEGAFARLNFDDVRFTRCRLDLRFLSESERAIWFTDCVLDTTVVVIDDRDAPMPWLNLRNVELRGGTEIPEGIIRRPRSLSSAPRRGTRAPGG
ncbi:pentapeptide repeat-containing protein [Amycolatopsis kentuckyensis]|uniref:pentapeptide repeat-containing protein n=1 Tax=Amycolatopsis kentuckyensis TaxID=218823 RepID=UPI003565ADD2